jgi:Leucine-rich repeat (LRR) protein
MRKLEEVCFAKNNLDELPEQIYLLPQVNYFSFFNNKIKSISDKVCNFTNLTYINVMGNELTDLPECLFSLPKINIINAGANRYSKDTIERLSKLNTRKINVFLDKTQNEDCFH